MFRLPGVQPDPWVGLACKDISSETHLLFVFARPRMGAKRGWVPEDGTDGTSPRERRNVLKLLRLRSKPWLQQMLGCHDTHPRSRDVMGIASAWLLSCKLLPLQFLASMISLQEGGNFTPSPDIASAQA